MEFKQWYETVAFKGNVTRNKPILDLLHAHIQKQLPNKGSYAVVSSKLIVDTIRHQFTDYDFNWKKLEVNKSNMDICDYLQDWNKIINETTQLVNKFIKMHLPEEQQEQLLQTNANWNKEKLKPIPAQCEDDDPRKWRTGFRRVPHSAPL